MTADQEQDKERPALPDVHEAWLPKEHALYRPRHGDRQRWAKVCAVVFLVVPIVAFGLGVRPAAFENRSLTSFPSPLQGWSFFSQLAPWATDHLPFREQAIHAGDWVSRSVFGEPPSYGDNSDQEVAPLPAEQTKPPVPSEFPTVLEGKDGWEYLGDELSSHCAPVQPLSATVAQLRKLRDGVQASGRQFVVVVAPDKTTMVPQYLPDDFPGKECLAAATKQFWQAMSRESYVLDLRTDLNDWSDTVQDDTPVYGPEDAHWGDQGGVIMARRIADALQPGISATWTIRPDQTWHVAADLPPLIGRTGTSDGRYYSILPDGVHDETQAVSSDFANQTLHFASASGGGTYGIGIGMLSDSFTIRATRYLSSVFGNITIMHHDSVEKDQGVAAGQMLANNNVVVIEVAERTLVSGQFVLLNPNVANTIIAQLAAHPIH